MSKSFKLYIAVSLIVHIVLILFLSRTKREMTFEQRESRPLVARIIEPDRAFEGAMIPKAEKSFDSEDLKPDNKLDLDEQESMPEEMDTPQKSEEVTQEVFDSTGITVIEEQGDTPLLKEKQLEPEKPVLAKTKAPEVKKEKKKEKKIFKKAKVKRATKSAGKSKANTGNSISGVKRPDKIKELPALNEGVSKSSTPPVVQPGNMLGKLFDSDIIAKHSLNPGKKDDSPVALNKMKREKKMSIDLEFDNLKYYSYMKRLKESIVSVWEYPQSEAMSGVFGDLIISFTIKSDGGLGAVEIVRTSGHRNLDAAAERALREAAPFWPLPESWGVNAFTITGHFVYNLYGNYLN